MTFSNKWHTLYKIYFCASWHSYGPFHTSQNATFIHLEIVVEDFDFVLQQRKPSIQFRPYTGIFIFCRPAGNTTFPIFSCFYQISPPVASSHFLPLLLFHVQSFPVQTKLSERLHLKSLLQRKHLHNLWSEKRISCPLSLCICGRSLLLVLFFYDYWFVISLSASAL